MGGRRISGYLYLLKCADGSYYTGSTTDLELRVAQHRAGEGGDYTARRLPVKLAYSCEFPTLEEAFRAERQVKNWSHAKKEALICEDFDGLIALSKGRTDDSTWLEQRLMAQARQHQTRGSGRHPEPVEGRRARASEDGTNSHPEPVEGRDPVGRLERGK